MIGAPRTVLLVEDDEATRRLYQRSLPLQLPEFHLETVAHGGEAVAVLAARPVEVLVTDLHMPVMDGFQLLAHVRERHANLGVVVLSSLPPEEVARAAPSLATYRRVAKPVSPAALAEHVRAAAAERVRGHIAAAPLAPLLQLLQLERSTCALLLRSGARKGRLHFRAGELVNAYAFELDAEGEDAARYLLSWDRASVDFERSLHNHVRTVHTPLEELLLDVAREQDERARPGAPAVATRPAAARSDRGPTATIRDAARGPDSPTPDGERAASPLDAALAGLASALGHLNRRGAAIAHDLEPALADARRNVGRPIAPLDPGALATTALDARLLELVRHLAERARTLGADDPSPPPPPTWRSVRDRTDPA